MIFSSYKEILYSARYSSYRPVEPFRIESYFDTVSKCSLCNSCSVSGGTEYNANIIFPELPRCEGI